jgi:hypothetical protein
VEAESPGVEVGPLYAAGGAGPRLALVETPGEKEEESARV